MELAVLKERQGLTSTHMKDQASEYASRMKSLEAMCASHVRDIEVYKGQVDSLNAKLAEVCMYVCVHVFVYVSHIKHT